MTDTTHIPPTRRWRSSSLAIIFAFWAILQLGGLFTPGLLDDVDSIYIQVAREMLQRHDFITPTIDGIRFFDKPPLMYWMAAGSMRLFGVHDWAARLPLALGVLALLFAVYALGLRFYSAAAFSPRTKGQRSPCAQQDRAGLYAALALATSLGPYLYTRFYIPDILIALWMTLSVHLFLIALDRIHAARPSPNSGAPSSPRSLRLRWASFAVANDRSPSPPGAPFMATAPSSTWVGSDAAPALTNLPPSAQDSALLPCLGFAAVTALNLLTKGLIGIVFPLGFVLLYLAFTRQLNLLRKLHLIPSTLVFLAIAAPWHILAALRNPPIPMPPGVGLPAHAGWAWFYLYNEHIARFLGRRIPHDYGQVPIPLFWLLLALWLFPWVAFLPAALLNAFRTLRSPRPTSDAEATFRFDSDANFSHRQLDSSLTQGLVISTEAKPGPPTGVLGPLGWERSGETPVSFAYQHDAESTATRSPSPSAQEAALACLLWAGIILGFFTLSSRQEYYHLPALPALALLVGGLLASADSTKTKQALRGSLYFLAPIGTLLFLLCGYFALTAPTPHPGVTLNDVLSSNPALYNLSLGHVFDLTGQAMGFFRGPLLTVALCMLTLGPVAYFVRSSASPTRPNRTFAANLLIAAAMTGVLLAAHEGLVRFYPILGSKDLALAIDTQYRPNDLILIDGELTAGSTLLFYTPQTAAPILLVNGRVNGPWFGSFYPDAPKIFPTNADLHTLWHGPRRIFLLTYHPAQRSADLSPYGPVHAFATSGGKTILSNQ